MPIITSDTTTSYGSGDDLFQISPLGEVLLTGEAVMWDDLQVPTTATKLGGSKDPTFGMFKDNGSGSQGVFTYLFPKNTETEVYFVAQLPHTYMEGTDIYFHVHFAPTDNNTGDVLWGLEYTWANIGDTYGNTTIIYATSTVDETTNGQHYIAGFSAISGAGKGISSILVCRVFRAGAEGTDTYENDVAMLYSDFHHEVDSFGSREEYVK